MTFDHAMFVIEVLLLIWIVVQGEFVRFYEREVWRMNAERFEERKKWRLEKQEQQRKKSTPKTLDSGASLESPSPSEKSEPVSKTISVKSAAAPSTPTDIRVSTTSTSK